MNKLLLILVSCFLSNSTAYAYGTFMASGNILQRGEYDLTGAIQTYSNGPSGSNAIIQGELSLEKDLNLRLSASTGEFDIHTGAGLKWVPISETTNRPNVGFISMLEFASTDSIDSFLIRIGPFVSKTFSWEHGFMEPYVGLPTGMAIIDSDNEFTSQLIVGTKVKFEQIDYMSFAIEGGFKVKNSFSHLALFATIQLGK